MEFCEDYHLKSLPASDVTVCLYITHLTKKVCYSSITSYICSVNMMHKYFGCDRPETATFLVRSTMLGAKRLLGSESKPALPLLPENIIQMGKLLDLTNLVDLRFWCALLLSFRCVLRVGHVTESVHALRVRDIVWSGSGMDVIINSSKTVQYRERQEVVPVVRAASALCPILPLKVFLATSCRSSSSTLFGHSYNQYSTKLKSLCKRISLVGQYSSHSVRRGAASFLATFMPLHDVKR